MEPWQKPLECSEAGCTHTTPGHRWRDPSWFYQKDGKAFCPDHIPEWVVEWRKRRLSDGK